MKKASSVELTRHMFLYAGTAMSRKEFTSWQKPRQKKRFFLVIITESLTVLQKNQQKQN